MKKMLLVCILLTLTLLLYPASITLQKMTGTVQIKESENAAWKTPSVGQQLQPGFVIYTGFNSTASIRAENATIEVKPLSQISIASLVKSADQVATDVSLKYGTIKAQVDKQEDLQTMFKVRSANSTASVRGTVFTFNDGELFVEEGTVHLLSNNGFGVLVQKNETASTPKLAMVKTPKKTTHMQFMGNSIPIGLSEAEHDALVNFLHGKPTGKAQVIIRIHIIN